MIVLEIGQAQLPLLDVDAAIADVVSKRLLPAIHIDSCDAIACMQQIYGKVEGRGGFARPAFFITHHNDMRTMTRHRCLQISVV
jgi:hypothetical protein